MPVSFAEPMRVIVLDGQQAAADSTALLFRWWGHQAHSLYGSESAFEKALDIKPNLMLIDLAERESEGLGLAECLRRQAGLECLQLVALSTIEDISQWRRAKSVGFTDYLIKPVPATEFLRVLLNARAAIVRSQEKALQSMQMASRAQRRNGAARAGLQGSHDAIKLSRKSLNRSLGSRGDSPDVFPG